jgi:hypothetical protein
MTNKDLSPNEAIIDRITIDNSRCAGCQKTGTDFMLTSIVGEDPRRNGNATFYDLFLSRAQVETLHAQIGALLAKVEKGPTTSQTEIP